MNEEIQEARGRLVSVLEQVRYKVDTEIKIDNSISGASVGSIVFGYVSNASTI